MNNRIEQGHRGITQRYDPMRGFGSFASAARFCPAHDELRGHLRPVPTSTKSSPWPSTAASSKTAGAQCARCCRSLAEDAGGFPCLMLAGPPVRTET